APREEESRGLDLSGLPAAFSADHDDDDGGDARRAAPRDRRGDRSRAAAPARHRDRRGGALLTDVDSVYDAGRLSLPRSSPAALARVPPAASPQARAGGIARMTVARRRRGVCAVVALVGLAWIAAGCAVGPTYKRPAAPMPTHAP